MESKDSIKTDEDTESGKEVAFTSQSELVKSSGNDTFHCLTAFGAIISVPLLLQDPLCMRGDPVAVSYIEGTIFVVSGIATLLQTTFGIRLPILQGSTFSFLVPTFAILSLPRWKCPASNTTISELSDNITVTMTTPNTSLGSSTPEDFQEVWQSRLREIQGAIMVASLFQVAIGFSGIMTFVLRLVSPLVVTPTITLVGLSLFDVAADKASKQWWIALLTMALIVIFSQCLYRLSILPFAPPSSEERAALPSASTFTSLNFFPGQVGHYARTDTKASVLEKALWIRIPYPGQWGLPTVSTGAVFGMLAGVLSSMIESVGDYYACARLSSAPPPPPHAINRGIGVEGIACVLAGAFGSGNGTTSFSENIAAIGITKVASRRVIQTAGVLMVILGCVGKVGAFFVALPDPVVGGMFLCMFRSEIADQIISVLLSTSMFVGGFVACVMDNLLPGTLEERGITRWRQEAESSGSKPGNVSADVVYRVPLFSPCIDRAPACGKLPFCPSAKVTAHSTLSSGGQDVTIMADDCPHDTRF
ncbi:hypothetical protein C0Q70_09552 [Pomacea canaliculata]|uniref:Solute carrier family 23 member 2 n=1 Tax=Pomacea canaliculata TaxID=400727 RepID=A0A2T7PA47_POMCA|nr:hypothetical protein C0Q70_09552 [Pomacea canaliculata]